MTMAIILSAQNVGTLSDTEPESMKGSISVFRSFNNRIISTKEL